RADDHDIARDNENDEPAGNRLGDAEGDVNRNQHGLVGERVEVSAELGCHPEAFGEEAVDGIADPGGEKQHEGHAHLARRDRPDHDRHQEDAAQRNEIWNAQISAPARPPAPSSPPALACGHAAAQYSRDQAIAQAGIPKYANAAKEAGRAMASLERGRPRSLLVSAWPRSASLC